MQPPNLLNDDGTASMATILMMSHHAFRRDLALFARALAQELDQERAAALRDEWHAYHESLHGHHMREDGDIFPTLQREHPALEPVIAQLSAEHRRIDPLLDRGDRAFAELRGAPSKAKVLVSELNALLDQHLATEEAKIAQHLRAASHFPPPSDDDEAGLYADGFAWSMHGIAPSVLEQVCIMLPEIVRAKLPAARSKYAERCERVWGFPKTGASLTPVPNWL
jgi:hemerythrin-like domain-containing protein